MAWNSNEGPPNCPRLVGSHDFSFISSNKPYLVLLGVLLGAAVSVLVSSDPRVVTVVLLSPHMRSRWTNQSFYSLSSFKSLPLDTEYRETEYIQIETTPP